MNGDTTSIFSRNRALLDMLIEEARSAYMDHKKEKLTIYGSKKSELWYPIASRPKRPLKSIILDPGVKESILDDAGDFLKSKTWYAERGIYVLFCDYY